MSLCHSLREVCFLVFLSLYSFSRLAELITLISSSLTLCSRPEFATGWMCSPDVLGLPESSPSRWTSSFCSSLSRPSCLRKKTTPRCETKISCQLYPPHIIMGITHWSKQVLGSDHQNWGRAGNPSSWRWGIHVQ